MADQVPSDDEEGSIEVERSQDFSDDGRNPHLPAKSSAQKSSARKQSYLASHKIIEKKRRDRINSSLTQLRDMVPDCSQYGNGKPKLDKAEILEKTIEYIKRLQRHSSSNVKLPTPGEASTPFSPPASELAFRSKLHQWMQQLVSWTQDHWQTAATVESFAEQLLRRMNNMAAEELEPPGGNIILEKVEPVGNMMCSVQPGQRHSLLVSPPGGSSGNVAIAMPPVLQPGSNTRTFDPLAPPLLPVVPPIQPRPTPAFPTGLFPPQPLRFATNPNSLSDSTVSEIFWQQQAHQALVMQPIRPQSASLSTVLAPPPIPAQAPPIVLHQPEPIISSALPDVRTTETTSTGRRVTFPQNSENLDDDGSIFQPRPKRLFLGVQNSGSSNAVTPSTPHAGNYSTVSTPHGANTPAGDATPLDMCSPTAVKHFPENTFRGAGGQTREQLQTITSANVPPSLTSPRPTPRSLPLAPPEYTTHSNPLSPLPPYSNNTAITPQRQLYAHSLLELAQHGDAPNTNRSLGTDLASGSQESKSIPTIQAPPLLAPNEENLSGLSNIAQTAPGSHMNGAAGGMLPGLNTQQSTMMQFNSSVMPMNNRVTPFNQLDMSDQQLATMRGQGVLPPTSLPLSETGSSENILTTPIDPNMGMPPNLQEEDLDMVTQTQGHASGSQPWAGDEDSEGSNQESDMPRPQNDSADSLLMLSGQPRN